MFDLGLPSHNRTCTHTGIKIYRVRLCCVFLRGGGCTTTAGTICLHIVPTINLHRQYNGPMCRSLAAGVGLTLHKILPDTKKNLQPVIQSPEHIFFFWTSRDPYYQLFSFQIFVLLANSPVNINGQSSTNLISISVYRNTTDKYHRRRISCLMFIESRVFFLARIFIIFTIYYHSDYC